MPPWDRHDTAQKQVGRRLAVWWSAEEQYFDGKIIAINPKTLKAKIKYDDGDVQQHALWQSDEEFHWESDASDAWSDEPAQARHWSTSKTGQRERASTKRFEAGPSKRPRPQPRPEPLQGDTREVAIDLDSEDDAPRVPAPKKQKPPPAPYVRPPKKQKPPPAPYVRPPQKPKPPPAPYVRPPQKPKPPPPPYVRPDPSKRCGPYKPAAKPEDKGDDTPPPPQTDEQKAKAAAAIAKAKELKLELQVCPACTHTSCTLTPEARPLHGTTLCV